MRIERNNWKSGLNFQFQLNENVFLCFSLFFFPLSELLELEKIICLHLFELFTREKMSQSHVCEYVHRFLNLDWNGLSWVKFREEAEKKTLWRANEDKENKINYKLQLFKQRQISFYLGLVSSTGFRGLSLSISLSLSSLF